MSFTIQYIKITNNHMKICSTFNSNHIYQNSLNYEDGWFHVGDYCGATGIFLLCWRSTKLDNLFGKLVFSYKVKRVSILQLNKSQSHEEICPCKDMCTDVYRTYVCNSPNLETTHTSNIWRNVKQSVCPSQY